MRPDTPPSAVAGAAGIPPGARAARNAAAGAGSSRRMSPRPCRAGLSSRAGRPRHGPTSRPPPP
jgi:hypothetical protein